MISIIVPIYNIKDYLPQCIDSLTKQSFSDIEIILVDDGSTDGCYEICEKYKLKDSRIIVIHKENDGLVSARKAGIEIASGDYIAYVDGDDWVEPDMYEYMYQKLMEQNVDVVMCGRYEDTENARKEVFHRVAEGRYGKRELLRLVYPKMIIGDGFFEWGILPNLWDKLFRRECVERFQMDVDDQIVMGEDAACVYPCLLNVDSIFVMHKCYYHYRQTTSSMVKRAQDCRLEKEQFRILYQSVNKILGNYISLFDLREQWKKFILFLMVPRADVLLEGIDDLEFLFPFPKVKKGSNIILYGMGTYGQRLYKYINQTGFCNILLTVDKNYRELRKQGLFVESPEDINRYEYDAIVVSSSFARTREMIRRDLIQKCNPEKIHVMSDELVMSEEIIKKFGIWDGE